MSNFPDYAGPLTETILLGNLAVWKRRPRRVGPEESQVERPGAGKNRPLRNTATATKSDV